MPHIDLPEGLPGISAGFAYRPETAKPMRELAHILLHEPGTLTPGERELIACFVQQDGKLVTRDDVEVARSLGATDLEIHDTVLIAAAFSMYHRYVDGLGTWQPRDPGMYAQMGKHLAEEGYTTPSIRRPAPAP